MVKTVVLGGVYQRTKINNVDRIPFFGNLPYVGRLFRRTHNEDDKKELLVFVTPSIIKDSLNQ